MNVNTDNRFTMRRTGVAFLLLIVFLLPLTPVSEAQNPIFGVAITCDSPAEMDVSPAGTCSSGDDLHY